MAKSDKFNFRKLDRIGAADAEDDRQFLQNCFVETGDLAALRSSQDSRTILLGRTGTGKTALLQRLSNVEGRTISIEPEALSLSYISNSTILTFLSQLGVNLDVFYKLLWRHVFAVEIIKSHFNIITEDDLSSFRARIRNYFRTEKERNAIKYLEKWGTTFWQETEYRVKEITTQFENQIKFSIGSQKLPFSSDLLAKLNEQQKKDIIHRAKTVLSNVQVRQLSDIIELIDCILTDRQKPYFITIDRLDEDWIEDKLRYKLIRALVQTAREFRRIRHAKIIIAIRQDLLERVFRLVRESGYQEEKYKSLYLPLNWSKNQLTEVLDARINYLVQQRYTKQRVTHRDFLPATIDGGATIDFIIDRTMMRPRDVIHFFNLCIQHAEGKPRINKTIIQKAEAEYSRNRVRYLADEWSADYPNLQDFAKILKKKPAHFNVSELLDNECGDFCIDFLCEHNYPKDRFYYLAFSLVEANLAPFDFRKQLFQIFYHVGLVGLKLESYEKLLWVTSDNRSVSSAEISDNTHVAIHKAFWRILGIRNI